jgi:arginase
MKIKQTKAIDIIGAPISLASAQKGASLGPDAIRIAGLKRCLHSLEHVFVDSGNIPSLEEPFPPRYFKPGEIRYLDEIYNFLRLLRDKVHSSLKSGYFPLILGGDHSVAISSLAASAKYNLENGHKPGLIWFDAHADCNTEETSTTGNIHGMPLAIAIGYGNKKLLSLFEGNFFDPKRTVIMGVRSVDPDEAKFLDQVGLEVFTMKDIDELGMLQCIKEAIKIASPENNPIHLSFDVDGLDTTAAPGTGTPVLGGITLREAHLLLEMLSETSLVQSMDMVEVNPILDHRNQTACIALSLLESALGKVIY